MQRTVTTRLLSTSTLALACLMASCAAPRARVASGWATDTAAPLATMASLEDIGSSVPVVPQDEMLEFDQIHPRTMITFSVGIGEQTNEINTGGVSQVVTSANDAQRFRLRGEHFFESGFGVFAEGFLGQSDDILQDIGAPSSSQDTTALFLAAGYRATMGENFRLPVRFGPFLHRTETDNSASTAGTLERETVGVRLSAEPEYVVMRRVNNGKVSELSVFGEVRAGAGATDVKDNVDSEEGYAFTLDYEFGVRYRFGFGLLASLSYAASKYHVGATESYNNVVFFGLDDDFNGIMITAGTRF